MPWVEKFHLLTGSRTAYEWLPKPRQVCSNLHIAQGCWRNIALTVQLGRQGRGGEPSTSSRVGGTSLPGAALCKHAVPQATGVLGGCDRLWEPLGRLAGQHRGPDQGGSSCSGTVWKPDQRRFSPDSQPRQHLGKTGALPIQGRPLEPGSPCRRRRQGSRQLPRAAWPNQR